jgi:hypothetical protein
MGNVRRGPSTMGIVSVVKQQFAWLQQWLSRPILLETLW